MRPKFIVLVGAKCIPCDPRGTGKVTGTYYGKTFDLRRWKAKPVCVNCETPMTKLWETKVPAQEYTNE